MNARDVGAKILSDHRDLRGALQALEQHLQQPADSQGWIGSLRDGLSGLVDLCSAHFEVEEQTGLHIQLREQSPRLAFRLERLVSDHRRILEGLQELARDLPAETIGRNEADPLKERVLRALETLHEHERAENEIMMDAYWDDLGGEG